MSIFVTKLFSLFKHGEKKNFIKLLLLSIVAALSQLVAMVSIVPFIAVLTNPELIEKNIFFKSAQTYLNFSSQIEMLSFSGFLVISTLLISNSIQALSVWRINKFGYEFGRKLSIRLMHEYITRPYLFFVRTNSAVLMKNINQEVSRVSNGILIHLLQGIAGLVKVLFIISLLIFVNVWATLMMALFIGTSYGIIGYLVKGKLTSNGQELSILATQKFKVVKELFGGIKEVKLLGREDVFLTGYEKTSASVVRHEIFTVVISRIPKYFLEILTFGSLLMISIYFLSSSNESSNVLPMIGLYVIAGYRMMPAMQEVYASFAKIKFAAPALDVVYKEFSYSNKEKGRTSKECSKTRMAINQSIAFEQIVFSYPEATKPALDQLSMEIIANSSIGLIGKSGSGKSTLVDILLGLLEPQQGSFKVDGAQIKKDNLRAWQNNIGYVPQHIYLIDDTITKNIALGVPDDEIDMQAVESAAQAASLHDFIIKELPQGYNNVIGESGVRLSGGQRQRIGIARALYHKPSILVLDEATSALDSVTETAVTESITKLSGKITTIIIAHRISTLTECDVIHRLVDGEIVESGNYNSLLVSSEAFRKLAKSTETS